MVDIPRTARDAGRAWVAEALAESGLVVNAVLADVEPEPLEEGSAVFGQLARLRLRYAGPSSQVPPSLILKLPTARPANWARGLDLRLYEREVRFYEEIAPKLAVRVPRCFWSRADPDSGRSALLLEDLGYLRTGDQRRGIGAVRAELAAIRLAGAHAQWWESGDLARMEWMPSFSNPMTKQLAASYSDRWPEFIGRSGGQLPAGSSGLGESVGESLEELLEALSAPPVTLIHADFRAANLMFGEGAQANAFAVVDWQMASVGRGIFDVAYLLCQSISVKERRAHEESIVEAWHSSLVSCGTSGYSLRDARRDYRRAVLLCIGFAVSASDLDRGDEAGSAVASLQAFRAFTAALDLDCQFELRSARRRCPLAG